MPGERFFFQKTGDWKLIVGNTGGLGQPKLNRVYLANLADERPETTNHAEQHPEIVQRLTKLHEQWIEEVVPEDVPGSAESPP